MTISDRRAKLLLKLEQFVRDVKRDPRAWSRESPGNICANHSAGRGFSMEVALAVALTGNAPRDADSTVRVDEKTWARLAAAAKRLQEETVSRGGWEWDAEQLATRVLEAGQHKAVRLGSAGMRDYFVSAMPRAFKSAGKMLLSI